MAGKSQAAPYIIDDVSQLPMNDDHLYGDPEYSPVCVRRTGRWDVYIQA